MTSRSDEWFADFIARVQQKYRSPARRYDLTREAQGLPTEQTRRERAYDDKTEQLTRFLRAQRIENNQHERTA